MYIFSKLLHLFLRLMVANHSEGNITKGFLWGLKLYQGGGENSGPLKFPEMPTQKK